MIALIQIALPTDIQILVGEKLDGLTYQDGMTLDGVGEVEVHVHPPYRSRLASDPGLSSSDRSALEPADPQPVDPNTTIDRKAAISCDAIAVNIVAPEFDRRRESGADTKIIALACEAVNEVLERLRVLTRATHLRPVNPEHVLFRLAFLDDTRKLVSAEEGKFRAAGNTLVRIQNVAVTPRTWQQVAELGEYEIPPWDQLLLDAMDLDAELGPSLVLAATAVETRIATALDILAAVKISEPFWTWIRDRDDDYTRTPSVAEQLDVLLEALGGRTLKEDNRLWAAGVHLRDARNSFVHEGRARFRKTGELVTREKAQELVRQADEIIDFIEGLLPEEAQRPQLEEQSQVDTTFQLSSYTR